MEGDMYFAKRRLPGLWVKLTIMTCLAEKEARRSHWPKLHTDMNAKLLRTAKKQVSGNVCLLVEYDAGEYFVYR